MSRRRQHDPNTKEALSEGAKEEWARYESYMADFKARYSTLFKSGSDVGDMLDTKTAGIAGCDEDEIEEGINVTGANGEKIECLVCMEAFPVTHMIFCIPPVYELECKESRTAQDGSESQELNVQSGNVPSTSTSSGSLNTLSSESDMARDGKGEGCQRCTECSNIPFPLRHSALLLQDVPAWAS